MTPLRRFVRCKSKSPAQIEMQIGFQIANRNRARGSKSKSQIEMQMQIANGNRNSKSKSKSQIRIQIADANRNRNRPCKCKSKSQGRIYAVSLASIVWKVLRNVGGVRKVPDRSCGSCLKEAMSEAGVTVGELSRRTGLSTKTITNLRSGRSEGNFNTWRKIASALGKKVVEDVIEL